MADPITTPVADACAAIQDTLDELQAVLARMDVARAEAQEIQGRVLRDALALHMPELPANVRPIRARAV